MKSLYVVGLLGLGLITLSACTVGGKEARPTPADNNLTIMENQTEARSSLTDGAYNANIESSVIRWRGERVIGSSHEGTVALQSGRFSVAEGDLSGGEFVIAMTSIKSDENNERLESHLKNEDFFQVDAYPEAKLVITNVIKQEEAFVYAVSADLTIKDTTAPVTFIAKLSESDGLIRVQADLSIDRTIWGIKYGSGKFFQDLGDAVIKDEMQLSVDIESRM